MAAASTTNVTLNSLLGGMNDEDSPNALPDTEAVLMENVELVFSQIGERRAGCEILPDVVGSPLQDETEVVHLSQYFPENDVTDPEWWAVAATPGVSSTFAHRPTSTWIEVTPIDAMDPDVPDVYQIRSQMLHGKLFFAYPSAQDRLHVWDGTTLRRTGIAQPSAAPTGSNEGSGSFTGTRYYRVRFIIKSGDDVLVRSEPSEVLTFNPNGASAGVTVTRPSTTTGETQTHWELEASDDGPEADFYRIATTAIATMTVDDETPLDGYPDVGELSEDIGEYELLPSARFLAADGDRLLFGGHFTDPLKASQVGWTPVFNDPGAGNDERLPLDANNTVDLNNYEGGGLTGISQVANGSWYAFKWSHIYQLVRTGDPTRAYEVVTISKSRGALPGSIVSGMDEFGRACIFFIDPIVGPSRIGADGLRRIHGLRGTYSRINLTASDVISHGVYYPNKRQVHWWISTEGADRPNKKIILHADQTRESEGELRGGWVIATGHICDAICSGIFNELLQDGELITLIERPFIGVLAPECILRCDTGERDVDALYRAIIRTRPYILAGLLNNWGGMAAALLADAHDTAQITVKFIRDFGKEEQQVTTDLLPSAADESLVVKRFDDLKMSEAAAIQFEFSDPDVIAEA